MEVLTINIVLVGQLYFSDGGGGGEHGYSERQQMLGTC